MKFGQRRPVVGLVVYDNAGWMAGSIYIRNIVYALASLPEAERPIVRLIGVLGANPDLLRELVKFDFVETRTPVERSKTQTLALRAVRKTGRTLLGAVSDPELRGVDVVFPCLLPDPRRGPQMFWIPDFQEHHLPEFFSSEERVQRI